MQCTTCLKTSSYPSLERDWENVSYCMHALFEVCLLVRYIFFFQTQIYIFSYNYQFIHLSLPVFRSIYLSNYLTVYLSNYLPNTCLSVCLSICPSVYICQLRIYLVIVMTLISVFYNNFTPVILTWVFDKAKSSM